MLNKNVADYTDFAGKTNKKIVQAPGGASSFSLAWTNEKIDYGPPRTIKKHVVSPSENGIMPPFINQQSHLIHQEILPNSHPISPQYSSSLPQKQPMYQPYDQQFNAPIRMLEPQRIPSQISNKSIDSSTKRPPPSQSYNSEEIDIAVIEQSRKKLGIPPTPPPSIVATSKPSVRMAPHSQQNILIGDSTYNYWKDNSREQQIPRSNRRIDVRESSTPMPEQLKTSVKVGNPPGGKNSFIFG